MVVVLGAPFTAQAEAQTCGNLSYDPGSRWFTIKGPDFSKGGQEITSHAVDPLNPRVFYVTNGSVAAVTTDTGCSWTETYKGPSGPGAPTAYVIQQVYVPSPHTVLLRIHETAPLSKPRIEVSTSGGREWRTGGVGLSAGEPEFLRAGEKASNPLYLGVDVGGGALDLIYASEDSGDTWVLRTDPLRSKALAGITDVEVDPVDPQTVWGFGPGGLYVSRNGAQSFSEVPEFAGVGRVGPVDVYGEVEKLPYIMAFRPEEGRLGVSRDGESWLYGTGIPSGIDAADNGGRAGDVIVSGSGGVFRYHEKSQGWPSLNAPSGAKGVIATHSPTLMLTARSRSSILRWIEPASGDGTGGFLDEDRNISLVQPPPVIAKNSTIVPDNKKIVIPVGESKSVEYKINLPRRRRPLDVFFLVDTSSSMTRTIDGLANGLQDIVNELAREGIDVNFGLAEYRTYPTNNPPKSATGDKEDSFVYKLRVDIQEGVQALADAISDLDAAGGGHYDAHLGALKQMATGEGQDLFPVGASNEEDVDPGQQASFRDKAIRVVINATDEKFGRSSGDGITGGVTSGGTPNPRQGPPPDIPSFEEVTQALNAKEIKQVGLSIDYRPYKDLTRMAQNTNTFAFGDGVDCDGNGSIDIHIGGPLVCKLRAGNTSDSAINLVPAVVNLLRAVQDPVPVELQAVEGQEVVEKIGPDIYESVILQTQNSLTFDVEFACSERQRGKRFPVTLQADSTVDLSDLSVDALVICKEDKEDEPEDEVLPVPPFAAPLIALAVPPPPPVPPSVAELSSATQSQAQSQAQAQGAAAHQEQQEPQLAYAAASGLEDEETLELNMTAYSDRRDIPASALMGMGAVALSMMFGAAMVRQRTQQRTRAQRQGR